MRYTTIFGILSLAVLAIACKDDAVNLEFTGRSTQYRLTPVSTQYTGSGTVTFRERTDDGTTIEVSMDPTGSGGFHPTHLHYGTYENEDAEMAAMLNPVDATTGASNTNIYQLLDMTGITYLDLLAFDGSIKIHLDDGPNKSVVLAAVNIGLNAGADVTDDAGGSGSTARD